MTIVTYTDGQREIKVIPLDDTAEHILVNTTAEIKVVESILIACAGTTANFTLIYRNRAGTDTSICAALPIAADSINTDLKNYHFPIAKGEQLRVKASAANHLTITAISLTLIPKNDNRTPAGAVR